MFEVIFDKYSREPYIVSTGPFCSQFAYPGPYLVQNTKEGPVQYDDYDGTFKPRPDYYLYQDNQ